MSSRSWPKRVWYQFLHVSCRLLAVTLYRYRAAGRDRVPSSGGVLVLSNHQSYLDPLVVGLTIDRRLNYLARDTLFRFAPFRWLIQSLDAIPIDREGLGLSGLKETLRRLKRGEMVLAFPEGTRTPDGEVGQLMPGFTSVARRAGVPLLPVGLDGPFDAFPRTALLPRLSPLAVVVGHPVMPEEIKRYSDRDLVAEIQRRIVAAHAEARALRTQGREGCLS